MLSSSRCGQRRHGADVGVVEPVARAEAQARVGRGARRALEALELLGRRRAPRRRQAVVARVQLDGAGAERARRLDDGRLGIDEEAHADARLLQAAHDLLERAARP